MIISPKYYWSDEGQILPLAKEEEKKTPRKASPFASRRGRHNRYTCPGGSALRHVIHGGPDTFFTPETALLEFLMGRMEKQRGGEWTNAGRERDSFETTKEWHAAARQCGSDRNAPTVVDFFPNRFPLCLWLSLRQSKIHRRPDVMTSLSRPTSRRTYISATLRSILRMPWDVRNFHRSIICCLLQLGYSNVARNSIEHVANINRNGEWLWREKHL